MASPFHLSRRVEFHQTDLAGIMHFSAYFVLMETAEHALLRSLGLNVVDQRDGVKVSFPRVSATCDFRRPLRYDDQFDIQASVQEIGEKSVTYGFVFSLGEQLIAEGQMTSVCCQFTPSVPPKSIPIPPDIADKLRQGLAE